LKKSHNDVNVYKEFDLSSCIPIPYIKNNIARSLKKVGLNIIHTIPKKLDYAIKRGKDKLPKENMTEVVYKIDCKDCEATYIGQTKRHVNTRIKEHRNNIKLHSSNQSVVSKHRSDHLHDFNWTAFDILHHEKYTKKREIAEMFYIKKFNNTINLQKDTDNLNPIYDRMIKAV